MENWKKTEEKGYQELLKIFPDAIKCGESDSTLSDVFIPSLNSFIEIKDLTNGCRCGQFTTATAAGDFCKRIMDETYSKEDIKDFIRNHYKKKKVSHFLVYLYGIFELVEIEQFLNDFNFSVQSYKKRSGTQKIPKKDRSKVLNYNPSFFLKEETIFCSELTMYNSYFNIDNDSYYINKKGEIKKKVILHAIDVDIISILKYVIYMVLVNFLMILQYLLLITQII